MSLPFCDVPATNATDWPSGERSRNETTSPMNVIWRDTAETVARSTGPDRILTPTNTVTARASETADQPTIALDGRRERGRRGSGAASSCVGTSSSGGASKRSTTSPTKRYPRRGIVAISSGVVESPFSSFRRRKMCWLRFASSTNVPGQSVLSISSLERTRFRCSTSSRRTSNAFGVSV